MKKDTLGIYIHIPFCVRKCAYCDFLSAPPASAAAMHDYTESLCKEIVLKSGLYSGDGKRTVNTVFFGGGTPSLLEAEDFNRIMGALRANFAIDADAEITVECNPDTVDFDKFHNYMEQGVNRISFGLQSACNEELKMLGRIHSYERFLKSYEDARRAGFTNINVDLISAIPGQTPSGWENTLRKVAGLEPEHISAYSLILEEGTRLFDEQDAYKFPTEDEDVRMYEATGHILGDFGYKRYEISNYAKKGRESRHNNKYWQREDYLGLGVGAASFVGNVRFSNIQDVDRYGQLLSEGGNPMEECVTLSEEESMAEFFYLGLRRMDGVSFKDFKEEFAVSPLGIYGDVIDKLVGQGLLEYINADGAAVGIKLSGKGIFLSNRVFMEFV